MLRNGAVTTDRRVTEALDRGRRPVGYEVSAIRTEQAHRYDLNQCPLTISYQSTILGIVTGAPG